MSKIKTSILSFAASELFLIVIELTFGIPLNAYYYLDLNFPKTTDFTFPFLLDSSERAEPAGDFIFMESLLSILLWFLTSPALLIAVVVYTLAPNDECKPVPGPHI